MVSPPIITGVVSMALAKIRNPASSARVWALLFAIAAIAGIALTALLAQDGDVQKNSIEFEAAKTCLTVLGAAVAGGVITLATSTYQSHRERIAESVRGDAHRREQEDTAIRLAFDETLTCYNGVKKIRRRLQAEALTGSIKKSDYKHQMDAISDHQLTFETLLKRVRVLNVRRVLPDELVSKYTLIEKYLNRIRDADRAAHPPGDDYRFEQDLRGLNAFLHGDEFKRRVSDPVEDILTHFQVALLHEDEHAAATEIPRAIERLRTERERKPREVADASSLEPGPRS